MRMLAARLAIGRRRPSGAAGHRGARRVRSALGVAVALALLVAPGAGRVLAHPGPLDQYGGHFDERTGLYHYHRPPKDLALEKSKYLEWVKFPIEGIIRGEAVKVTSADTLWIRVDYRPAFQELAQNIALANKNERDKLLRVDLAYVSPQETGARGARFEAWFLSKVAYELKQKVLGHQVSVNFQIVGGSASRLRGMVFEDKDNVNLWMVLNGWSYYVLDDGPNPYDKLFRNAEDLARRNKSGIWQPR